jgi:cell division protein FtsZ
MPKRRETESGFRRTPQQQQSQEQTRAAAQALAAKKSEAAKEPEHATVGAGVRQPQAQPRPPQFDDDDLDVPDFLK